MVFVPEAVYLALTSIFHKLPLFRIIAHALQRLQKRIDFTMTSM